MNAPASTNHRVALIGNMNNNYFAYARHLRDRGIEADLIIPYSREHAHKGGYDHFHPSMDTFDERPMEFVKQCDWFRFDFDDAPTAPVVRADLAGYDRIMGDGWAPSFVNMAGLQLDIFSPYGSDLYDYPWMKDPPGALERMKLRLAHGASHWRLRQHRHRNHQREGIANARCVLLQNRKFKEAVDRIGIRGELVWTMLPFIHAADFTPDKLSASHARSDVHSAFREIRDGHDLVFFHHSRQVWKTRIDDFSWKGNDVLIRGFAEFVRRRGGLRACLVMLEYGPDVGAAKELVRELGIEKNVRWFPTMPRKEIMVCISLSDMVCTEFALAWAAGGAFFEPLAMGKPMMHKRDEAVIRESCPEAYPSVAAATSDEVCAAFLRIADHPDEFRRIGEEGRAWFNRVVVKQGVDTIVRLLHLEAQN